jgi:dimethylamine monooxygenase subunit A
MPLAELFPPGDYRFHLTLRRGEQAEFFRARDATGAMLAERRRWIAENPARYTALTREGGALLEELRELAPA